MMTIKEREEIVKGLECCLCDTRNSNLDCDTLGCPYYKLGEDCISNIMTDALTLIKELTEEIKTLEADYERVYEQAEADIRGNMADGGTSCHWCAEKTKADTVKRMQERLKAKSFRDVPVFGEPYSCVDFVIIDQVAKELLEESK